MTGPELIVCARKLQAAEAVAPAGERKAALWAWMDVILAGVLELAARVDAQAVAALGEDFDPWEAGA